MLLLPWRRIAAVWIAASLGTAGAAAAQAGSAALQVTVTDAATGEPLPSTQIVLGGTPAGVTDPSGVLRVSGLEPSARTVEVRRLGYRPERSDVRLEGGQTRELAVALRPEPITLKTLNARSARAARSAPLRDFYKRVESGAGRYVTRADIDRQRPQRLTDVFRNIPGMSLIATAIGERPQMASDQSTSSPADRPGRALGCSIRYFLDGTPFEASHDGQIGIDVRPSEVEGIEIYRSPSTVPARFRRTGDFCGVVLIWKRERI